MQKKRFVRLPEYCGKDMIKINCFLMGFSALRTGLEKHMAEKAWISEQQRY